VAYIFGKISTKAITFVLELTSIEGLNKKLWISKVTKVPILGISGLPTLESRDKMTFECNPFG